jgi:hypothetical protein
MDGGWNMARLRKSLSTQRSLRLVAGCAVAACIGAGASTALGDINIDLVPVSNVVSVGDVVEIQVYITSDSSVDQFTSAVDMIFSWETSYLQLNGNSQVGAVNLLASGFPSDPWGINDANPPQSGTGVYTAFAPLGDPVAATPSGTLLTTLLFTALAATPATYIDILESLGGGTTTVFDGTQPNTPVTGDLNGTFVTIIPAPGVLGVFALAMLGSRHRRRA